LDSGSDRNDNTPPEYAFAVLTAQRLLKARKGMKTGRTISARSSAVNWKMGKLTMDQAVAASVGGFNRR
jgi:myo-inositol catabolism protein IolC